MSFCPRHQTGLRALFRVVLCLVILGSLALSFTSVWAATRYPEQRCLELLKREQFREAIACTMRLSKRAGKSHYSLSLGLIHEKVGDFYAGHKSAESCYHFDRAVFYYRRYLRRHKHLQREQVLYVKKSVARLLQRSQYAQLSLDSHPGAVNVVLHGHRRKWEIRLPHQFRAMCPGTYRMTARKAGFQATTSVFVLKRKQKSLRHIRLRPAMRRPFRMPAWGWTLLAAAGIGAAGGVLYFVAENRRQTLEARLGQDTAWKENRNVAQALSSTAVCFFVGSGVLVGTAVALSLFLRRKARATPGSLPQQIVGPAVGQHKRLDQRAALPSSTPPQSSSCWSGDGLSWGMVPCL